METVETDRPKSLEIPQIALIISTISSNVPDYYFLIPPNRYFFKTLLILLGRILKKLGELKKRVHFQSEIVTILH